MKDVLVLGIESSCDETACAVVKNGREVLSDVIASQADFHEQFGGVVPELASRLISMSSSVESFPNLPQGCTLTLSILRSARLCLMLNVLLKTLTAWL